MAHRIIIWFCFSLQTASIWAQNANGVYDNETLHPGIYTAQLYKGDNELLYPVIDLNASEYLTLEFDLLSDQAEDFYVTLLHCNQDWRLSEMQPIEYYEGYSYERMLNYKPAQGTSINFLHYSHRIPFGGGKIKISGNYVVKVYRNNDPNNTVLTRRFIVTETLIDFAADLGMTQSIGERYKLQQVKFTIAPRFTISNPSQELKVLLMQNFRWDTAKLFTKANFNDGTKYEYVFNAENDFKGGNEFRMLDARSFVSRGIGVQTLVRDFNGYVAQTVIQKPRSGQSYFSDTDLNGNYFVGLGQFDKDFGAVNADYMRMIFRLELPEYQKNDGIYVLGAFNDWKISPTYLMRFNNITKLYEADVILKQGVYNYCFVVANPENGSFDEQALEGSHYETENFYNLVVYYHRVGDRYDRVVGVRFLNYYENK